MDNGLIVIAIIVGVTVVVGLAVAFAVMSAVTDSNIMGFVFMFSR